MRLLLALYPRGWRRRYGAEFGAVLDEQRSSPGLLLDVVLGAIDAHLDPQVADDGEESLRRRMKGMVMRGRRSRTAFMAVGLMLPLLLLAATFMDPAIRHGGVGLPLAVAFASGLLVGRWWASLPLLLIFVAWLVSANISWTAEGAIYFGLLLFAFVLVCFIGVGVRMLFTGELAHLGDPAGPGK